MCKVSVTSGAAGLGADHASRRLVHSSASQSAPASSRTGSGARTRRARSCTRRESPPCYSAHAARAGRLGRAERTGRTRGDADGRSGVAALRRLEALDKAASIVYSPHHVSA